MAKKTEPEKLSDAIREFESELTRLSWRVQTIRKQGARIDGSDLSPAVREALAHLVKAHGVLADVDVVSVGEPPLAEPQEPTA